MGTDGAVLGAIVGLGYLALLVAYLVWLGGSMGIAVTRSMITGVVLVVALSQLYPETVTLMVVAVYEPDVVPP